MNGPSTIAGTQSYVADIPASALPTLQAQLGPSNARRYIDALRDTPAVRAHARANFRARKHLGKTIAYHAPLTFCGHSDIDMDEDPAEAPELVE